MMTFSSTLAVFILATGKLFECMGKGDHKYSKLNRTAVQFFQYTTKVSIIAPYIYDAWHHANP